jgi:hypothetical protein
MTPEFYRPDRSSVGRWVLIGCLIAAALGWPLSILIEGLR